MTVYNMEKTNKIEKININCATKIEQLNQMYDLLNAFKDKYGEYKRMTPTEEKVFNTLYELCDKEELDIVESQKKIQEFFKDKLGKYWKMRVTVCHDGNEYTEEYIMYLYDFDKYHIIKYFFAVMSNDIQEHKNFAYEMKVTSFSVDWFFRGDTTIEMEEITKEEFVNIATKRINDILDYHLMRLEQQKESNK